MKKLKYETNKDNLLSKIFEQREDELYEIKNNERKLISQKSKDYSNIDIAIDNLPDTLTETRKGIKDSIEKYLERLNEIQGIENEKFYKEGFSDAIKLIFSCCGNENNKEKDL
ncbi:MAG: hypothetical protein KIC54_03835 [Clostridium sp.]|nr:hypothetical protein [Clostridium sp.]